MLLLSGSAGSGKSVLTRFVAETILSGGNSLQTTQGYLGVTFFCSYCEVALSSENAVLRSILHQLIQKSPASQVLVRNILEQRTPQGLKISLATDLLWQAIRETLAMDSMKNTFIAIDAIEELGSSTAMKILTELFNIINALNTLKPTHRIRVFVSSRHNANYNSSFPSLVQLRIMKSEMQPEIKKFLRDVIDQFAIDRLDFAGATSSSKRVEIIDEICKRADGMFLLAVMVWDDFRKTSKWDEATIDDKMQRLDSAPLGMYAFYDKMMYQIDASVREDILEIFAILAVAARPLSTRGLETILGLSYTGRPIRKAADIPIDRDIGNLIEKYIPDLIARRDDDTLTFVHLSFKEYLLKSWDETDTKDLVKARRIITRACLKYLRLQDLLHDALDGESREGKLQPKSAPASFPS